MRKYAGGSILLILSLLFVIGEQTVAGPCPVMPDGRFMVCRWASQAAFGVGGRACHPFPVSPGLYK